MSGGSFPEGLCTLRVTHHRISQPSTASWQLASASRRLLGHVSHHARWPAPLMPKGSWDACTSHGIATFLLAVFTAQLVLEPVHRCPACPQDFNALYGYPLPRVPAPYEVFLRIAAHRGHVSQ